MSREVRVAAEEAEEAKEDAAVFVIVFVFDATLYRPRPPRCPS
jgi:hypothetical protein